MTHPHHPAAATLHEVAARWPDLAEARHKGTHRHGHTTYRHPDTLDEGEGLGSIPAPIHLDILDAMASILMWADLLHEQVAQAVGHPRLPHPSSAGADPRPYLAYTIELLPEAVDTRPAIGEEATAQADRMKSLLLSKLGEVYDGQMLDAVCPFCVGQTFRRPAGERTMRVRLVDSRLREGAHEWVIVCENPDGCRPFAAECDMWVRGRPAWPWSQWEWLAARLLPVRAA